jgi:glutaredoxin
MTWIDDKGEFHVEDGVAKVPESARDVVRVADPSKEPPSGDRIFVVDLRAPGPDGGYPVRLVARAEFEDVAVARRKQHGTVLAAAPPASAAGSGSAGAAGAGGPGPSEVDRPPVIIYGASWCGPCHQAAAYLKKRGVRFIEHDIEQDSVAAREMQAKLAKVGSRGGSIPVIDVRGTILVGFDAAAVERALAKP